MMKSLKLVCTVLVVAALMGGVACAQTSGLPSPITDYDDAKAMWEAYPDVALTDAPEGAEDVRYSSITGGTLQILFNCDGEEYTYRGCVAESVEEAEEIQPTLTGVYQEFDGRVDGDTEDAPFTLPEFAFETIILYSQGDGSAVVYWYDDEMGTLYSLYGENAGMPVMKILDVAALLQTDDAEEE